MARLILLITGAFIAAVAIPSYFLLCLWVSVIDSFIRKEKRHEKRKEKRDRKNNEKCDH